MTARYRSPQCLQGAHRDVCLTPDVCSCPCHVEMAGRTQAIEGPGLDLEAIRARVEAAMPGPWRLDLDGCCVYAAGDLEVAEGLVRVDAEFIAHARQDVPALLDEVDRLTGERERLLDICDQYQERLRDTGERGVA